MVAETSSLIAGNEGTDVVHASISPIRTTSRNRLKRCEPLWPASAFTPQSVCPHGVKIGQRWYCPICHLCGQEGHPELARDPRTDPKPDPPKVCAPELPGGIGSVKAKPTWTVPGIAFNVQAWTKAEARQLIRDRLRNEGESGRLSVPVSNPKRVKALV